jgi:two-component system, OmpR family, KDP operon response regulator KdpE
MTQSPPRLLGTSAPLTSASVLVVEDDPAVRGVLIEALEAAGLTVSVAGDGFAALNEVRRTPPDVVVLDLGLPVLDGQEFVDAWETASPGRSVPILVLSGSDELPPFLANLGVQGHMTKPFDIEQVVATVRRLANGPRV